MPTEADWQELATAARHASVNAYCPYSRFPVGAAVRTSDGRVFAGCNVENASFGHTICAERNAIFHTKFLSCPTTMFAACQHGMRFINKNARAMRLCDSK